MGFLRFRRSFRIAPGLRVNLSKSGVSTSIGRRGAWFTIGPRGTRETIGVPGAGLSYTEQQRLGEPRVDPEAQTTPAPSGSSRVALWLVVLFVVAVAITLAVVFA